MMQREYLLHLSLMSKRERILITDLEDANAGWKEHWARSRSRHLWPFPDSVV